MKKKMQAKNATIQLNVIQILSLPHIDLAILQGQKELRDLQKFNA